MNLELALFYMDGSAAGHAVAGLREIIVQE
jgi:hypothetical protein